MYNAPIADYALLLRHVVAGDQILGEADADLTVIDALEVLGTAAQFAVDVLHPLNAVGDRTGSVLTEGLVTTPPGFTEAFKGYVEGGWVGFVAPASAGGDGLPRLLTNAVEELWSAANPAFALCTGLTAAAIAALNAAADDDQRATYLGPMVEGRWTGTMNLTEPQAGTDLASINTMARLEADGSWRVSGQKIFITWGDHDIAENIVHLVLARTPDAPEGLAGLSLFIVPKFLPTPEGTPGERNTITTVALENKLGIHASPTCVLQYEDATGFLLGQQHRGLQAMFVMMNFTRVGIGIQGLGIADRAYQQARDYAEHRVQGKVLGEPEGAAISGHPDVARLLASMASTIAAMRGVLVQTSAWQDQGARGDAAAAALGEFFAPVVKGWFAEESVKIASDAIQVHGGAGFIEETGVAQYYRDARIVPIYEGTTAVQANDLVGRKLTRDGGTTAKVALDLVESDLVALRMTPDPVAQRTAERLARAVVTVRTATDTLIARAAESPRDVFAASVGYLTMWGLLAGGWMHGRMLLAAISSDDPDLSRRAVEAEFFGAHHLSRIASLAEALEAGEIR